MNDPKKTDEEITRHFEKRRQDSSRLIQLAQTIRDETKLVVVTDYQDIIIFTNEACLAAYGYKRTELIGQHISILRSARNEDAVTQHILSATLGGGWAGELWQKRKDGSEFRIHVETSVIKDQSGYITGLIGVFKEIEA